MANQTRLLLIFLLFSLSNVVLGAVVVRGFHNNNINVAPRYDNTPDNWSYHHYYNGDNVIQNNDVLNADNVNPVVVHPVVVNPVVVNTDNDLNPVNNDTNSVKIYQYTDENGVTHFSDLPFK